MRQRTNPHCAEGVASRRRSAPKVSCPFLINAKTPAANRPDSLDVARSTETDHQLSAAGATINLEVGTLRAILVRHRLWANIQPDVKKRPERDDVGVALDADAEERLLAACLASRSRLLWPAVVLALNTGLRRSELFGLRWKQIDSVNWIIRVGESKTRAGRHREVPLNSRARVAIQTWAEQFPDRADDHFVFPSEHVGAGGDNFDANISGTEPSKAVSTLKTAWHTAKKAAKVKARWHDLHHTAVTWLLENG